MSTGTINANSFACGYAIFPQSIIIPYVIGSIWYIIDSAKIGILEAVSIKKYNIICSRKTFGRTVITYIDTQNDTWNGTEFCDKNTAVQLAIAYYEGLLDNDPC